MFPPKTSTNGASIATNNTLLEDLDDFSLLAVFDFLRLPDLFNIGTLSRRFHDLTVIHFLIPKYHLNERDVSVISYLETYLALYEDDELTSIDGHKQTLNILQLFGHIFKRITIKVQPGGYKNVADISHYINEYCSADALQEVIMYRGKYIIDDGNYSFKNVRIVTLRHIHDHDDSIQLNDAFPRMEQLDIDYGSNLSYIHFNFPHLLSFRLHSSSCSDNDLMLRTFYRLNRQLRSVEAPMFVNHAYLTYLNEMLPNLESLSIRNLNSEIYGSNLIAHDVVRFKNVKHFSLDLFTYNREWNVGIRQRLSSIQFDHLESYTVTSNVIDSTDYLIGLIVRNTAVANITIPSSELKYEQLSTLIDTLPNLRELTIGWAERETCDELGRFFVKAFETTRLEKINVLILETYGLWMTDVLEIVPPGWTTTETRVVKTSYLLQLERSE